MPGIVVKAVYAIFIVTLLAAGLFDLCLYLSGQMTITTFFRDNPAWFWSGAILMAAFLVLLFIHLWIEPLWWQ